MAWVNPRIAEILAHTPEAKATVRATRDRGEAIAQALFAPHDNPGGHEITTQDDRVDALLSLDGPAPLSVEFGHWSGDGENRRYVEGLHILGRTLARMEAEARD